MKTATSPRRRSLPSSNPVQKECTCDPVCNCDSTLTNAETLQIFPFAIAKWKTELANMHSNHRSTTRAVALQARVRRGTLLLRQAQLNIDVRAEVGA